MSCFNRALFDLIEDARESDGEGGFLHSLDELVEAYRNRCFVDRLEAGCVALMRLERPGIDPNTKGNFFDTGAHKDAPAWKHYRHRVSVILRAADDVASPIPVRDAEPLKAEAKVQGDGDKAEQGVQLSRPGPSGDGSEPDADRQCTCHPADNPPRPCPQRYALSKCRLASKD